MKGENAPPPDGWQLPPRTKCCGVWSNAYACDVCGNWLKLPESIVRGDN